jgi:hypothetical protein
MKREAVAAEVMTTTMIMITERAAAAAMTTTTIMLTKCLPAGELRMYLL